MGYLEGKPKKRKRRIQTGMFLLVFAECWKSVRRLLSISFRRSDRTKVSNQHRNRTEQKNPLSSFALFFSETWSVFLFLDLWKMIPYRDFRLFRISVALYFRWWKFRRKLRCISLKVVFFSFSSKKESVLFLLSSFPLSCFWNLFFFLEKTISLFGKLNSFFVQVEEEESLRCFSNFFSEFNQK